MKILVALDDSPNSARAAHEAAHLFPGSQFYVINVTEVPQMALLAAAEFGAVLTITNEELKTQGPSEADIADLARRSGLDRATVLTTVGDPSTAICRAADEHDVDVVVVGSHDKGVLRRLLDPSVADSVVHRSHRPVLVVGTRPPAR